MVFAKRSTRVVCGVVVCAALVVGAWAIAGVVYADARAAELEGMKSAALATLVGARSTTSAHVQSMLTLAEGFVARPNKTHPMPIAPFQSIAERFSKFGGTQPRVTSMSVAVPVLPSEREEYEAAMGTTIRGFPPPKQSVAPGPLGYFTVTAMLFPLRLYDRVYGVDVHDAQVARGLAMDRCIQENIVVATGIIYPANELQRPGATFHAPIRYEDRGGRWGVLAMFVERELFAGTFKGHGLPASVQLQDRTDPAAPEDLYVEPPQDGSAEVELATLQFEVATRVWHVRMVTTEDVLDAHTEAVTHTDTVLVIGILVAVLFGVTTFVVLDAWDKIQTARLATLAGSAAEAAHVRLLKFLNHELRNPLAVVIACVDQMLSSPSWPLSEELMGSAADAAIARQDMRVVLDAAQKMALVLEDAAEVKRMGDVGTKPTPEHTDTVGVLRDTANQLSPFMKEQSDFIIRTHPGVPRAVMVDGRLLRHIVTAAAQNAMTHSSGTHIELRARALTAQGGPVGGEDGAPEEETAYVVVEVLNTGRGLQGKSETELMGMQLVTATVAPEVRRAAARPTLEPVADPGVQSSDVLAMLGHNSTAASSAAPEARMFSMAGSTVDEATNGVTMTVSGMSASGSSVTAHRGGYAGVGATMNLTMCYRLAVAMGGAAGIADVPAADVSRKGLLPTSRAADTVTRFWVVVEAPPATEPPELDLLAAVIARDRQAELKEQLSRSVADEDSLGGADGDVGAAEHSVTFNACNGAVSSLSPAKSLGVGTGEAKREGYPGAMPDSPHAVRHGRPPHSLPAIHSNARDGPDGATTPSRVLVQQLGTPTTAQDVGDCVWPHTGAGAGAGAGVGAANGGNHMSADQRPAPVATSGHGPRRQSREERTAARRAKRAAKKRAANAVVAPDLPGGVIVVDDERMFRRAVTRYLTSLKAGVTASLEDGDELLPTLELLETPPSAVLLDIVMRRSVGVDVLKALRQEARWATLPVYAMTSNVERVEEYRAAGFNGLLGKPFSKAKLAAALHHAVNEEVRQRTPFLDATKL